MAYTGAYVFGDSLVDSGNALKLAKFYGSLPFTALPDGAPTADKGYFQGRFSNGYVFTDLISNKAIGQVSKPVFPFGYDDPWLGIPLDPFAGDPSGNNLNFAYGGAHVIKGDEAVSDFDEQTDAARDAFDGHYPHDGLYLVTFGGNDVRDLAPARTDPVPQAEAHAQLDAVAREMLDELSQMIDGGAYNIVISGIPNCGAIPDYDRDGNGVLNGTELMRSAAATDYSIYLDNLVRTQVVPALQQQLAARGVDPDRIVYAPIMDYTDASGHMVTGALNANLPTLAALHNVTPPADFHGTLAEYLAGHLLEYRNLVFFDLIHPNAQAHALLASYMQSLISGTPWVETMPMLGADVDYRASATIGAAGEVDRMSIAMVAGTTYTFQMLGVSTVTPFVLSQLGIASLGSGPVLADPSLRLVSPGGTVVQSDDDSGIGLDSSLAFTVAAAGTYTLEASAVGSLTGSYLLTATVSGAAMLAGNSYTISNPLTVVLEGAGGIGVDTVRTSVSYALSAGSEIEVLGTTNDRGKGAMNLTGNEFGQTIVGNNGANVIEGKGGADVMTGGGGNDTFVLSSAALSGPGNIDTITDYAKGDLVDVTQILSVATGVNVLGGGYLRVTTGGQIQVDVNGGGDNWVTLSAINGNSAVQMRYLSGGAATSVSVNRVTTTVLTGAVAAAGLMATPLAAAPHATGDELAAQPLIASTGTERTANAVVQGWHSAGPVADDALAPDGPQATALGLPRAADSGSSADVGQLTPAVVSQEPLSTLAAGADAPPQPEPAAAIAHGIVMPVDASLASDAGEAKHTGEVGRVLADALAGGESGLNIDALLNSLPAATSHAPAALAAMTAVVDHAAFAAVQHAFAAETIALHPDAPPAA